MLILFRIRIVAGQMVAGRCLACVPLLGFTGDGDDAGAEADAGSGPGVCADGVADTNAGAGAGTVIGAVIGAVTGNAAGAGAGAGNGDDTGAGAGAGADGVDGASPAVADDVAYAGTGAAAAPEEEEGRFKSITTKISIYINAAVEYFQWLL